MPASRISENIFRWSLLAVLIYVVSSAIIRYVALPPSPQEQASRQGVKYQSTNDARFRSLLSAGNKAIKNGRYSEALESFQEAERSADQLTADQYASLKNSRLQIASLCEASGNNAEAENAYKALAGSAMQQGRALLRAKHCDAAVEKFGDAEKFSEHLTETKQASLLESRASLAGCLEELRRIPEAVATTQRMIDDLRTSPDQFDPALSDQYMILAREYSVENDWNSAEQAILSASASSDKIIAHFATDLGAEAEKRVSAAIGQKDVGLRWLITAYNNQGKTDLALSMADDYVNYKLEAGGRWGVIQFHAKREIAQQALQIATAANRPDAIDLWRQRLNTLQ